MMKKEKDEINILKKEEKKEEIKILNWLTNDKSTHEAATKEFDVELLKENRKINPHCQNLGATIFDALVGGPRAIRQREKIFDMRVWEENARPREY
eukprot:92476-Heterocapsa_arctica.AAC.1